MSRPEVDLRIENIQNTHKLTVIHEDHLMSLDLTEVSHLISDLLAGRALLLHTAETMERTEEPVEEPDQVSDLEEPLTWHRERPGKYFAHPSPEVTLKAEKIAGTKAWIAKRNGKIVARDLSSYASAKEVLRDGLSAPPVK